MAPGQIQSIPKMCFKEYNDTRQKVKIFYRLESLTTSVTLLCEAKAAYTGSVHTGQHVVIARVVRKTGTVDGSSQY